MQDADKVQQISILNNNASIEIDTSNNDKIQASLTGSEGDYLAKELSLTMQNHTLQIIEKDKDAPNTLLNAFSIKRPLKLTIHLPAKLYKELIVQSDNGSIQIQGVKGNKIVASTENGDVQLQKTEGTFSLKSDTGSIQIDSIFDFKGLNKAKSKYGNIDIKTGQKPSALQFDLQSKYGSVHSDYSTGPSPDEINQRIQSRLGNSTANQPTLHVHSETGNVTFRK